MKHSLPQLFFLYIPTFKPSCYRVLGPYSNPSVNDCQTKHRPLCCLTKASKHIYFYNLQRGYSYDPYISIQGLHTRFNLITWVCRTRAVFKDLNAGFVDYIKWRPLSYWRITYGIKVGLGKHMCAQSAESRAPCR